MKVKGIVFISTVSFIKRKFGFSKYSSFISENASFKAFENYSPVEWYPLESLIEFHTRAESFFGFSDLSLVKETAAHIAEDAFDSSFRIFKNLSAKVIVSNIQSIINTCYTGIRAVAEQKNESAAVVEMEGRFNSAVFRGKLKSWLASIISKTSGRTVKIEELKSGDNTLKICVEWED